MEALFECKDIKGTGIGASVTHFWTNIQPMLFDPINKETHKNNTFSDHVLQNNKLVSIR
jgi:hypothetical protein